MVKRVAAAMALLCVVSWLALAQEQAAEQPAPKAADNATNPHSGKVVLEGAEVTLIDEAKVPAQEAGVIISVEAYEGLDVEEGTELAQLDKEVAEAEVVIATKEWEAAQKEASSDLNIQLAKKTKLVADAEYDQVVEANRISQGAKSQAEIRMKKYTAEKSALQIDQAKLEKEMAGITATGKKAQADAAQIKVERRKVRSPLSGKVVQLFLHKGEWANPGDPILHVVRMDRLRVVGFVNAELYDPGDIRARAVELQVNLAGGRPSTFQGKVTFVDPRVAPGGKRYMIHAEVVNRQENGDWVLQPGLKGNLFIDVNRKLEERAASTPPKSNAAPRATKQVR